MSAPRRIFVSGPRTMAAILLLVSLCNAGKLPPDLKVRQDDGSVVKWNVVFSSRPMCMVGDSGAKWGVTSCNRRTITLWTGLDREQMADIFLHELMHVVTNCEDRDEDLHDSIYTLAPGVRRILRDNPKWAKFVLRAPVSLPPVQYGTGPIDRSCVASEKPPETKDGD